ncbi:hypothetical protein DP939_16475 [Spongiactinospora rosea]|uniref:Integral membrane bound transporter domain-containing protein n=1 Tax=Spongiactinospora rosea TaxID=2248750 RepID=A0A366LZM8_9ACTN|nr:hypothetical protein DP939_16475 [Spongiactinospora rosea]
MGGHLVSPGQVVFIDTESAGEVVLQGVRRFAGTVAGAVLGYGLAVSAGSLPLVVVLLLVCMFGMFYTPPGA